MYEMMAGQVRENRFYFYLVRKQKKENFGNSEYRNPRNFDYYKL